MANEAKILITEQGAKQTQAAIEQTGQAAKKMGADVNAGADAGAKATDKVKDAAEKTTGQLEKLGTKALDMVAGFAGLQAVIKLIENLNEQLIQTIKLRDQALNSSLSPLQLGQQMVVQTGSDNQKDWAAKILQLQQTAGFSSAQSASELLTSMDVEYTSQGGVGNQKIMDLTAAIAPDLAAMNLSPQQVSAVIKFAGTAGIKPDAASFRKFFAQVQTGFTKSKSTDMSSFISGLQKGGTAYIAQGGSLESAISNYSGALSVSANENLASTLLEQASRLAGGGYEKPRQAIESAYGVSFGNLSIDQRYNMLIDYAARLPESQRLQFLVEAGIPAEVASGFNKLATPGAMRTMAGTRTAVMKASAGNTTAQTKEFQSSVLYRANRTAAAGDATKLNATINYNEQIMLRRRAEQMYDDMVLRGEQPLMQGREATIAELQAELAAEVGGYERGGLQRWVENAGFVSAIGGDRLQAGLINASSQHHYRNNAGVQINYNYDRSRSSGPAYTQDE